MSMTVRSRAPCSRANPTLTFTSYSLESDLKKERHEMHVPCHLSEEWRVSGQSTTAMPLSPRLLMRGASWRERECSARTRVLDLAWSDPKRRPNLPSSDGRRGRLGSCRMRDSKSMVQTENERHVIGCLESRQCECDARNPSIPPVAKRLRLFLIRRKPLMGVGSDDDRRRCECQWRSWWSWQQRSISFHRWDDEAVVSF